MSSTVMSQQWSRIVTASVTPVVVISACGLMSLAIVELLSALDTVESETSLVSELSDAPSGGDS